MKSFSILNNTVLVVELPEGAHNLRWTSPALLSYDTEEDKGLYVNVKSGNWQPLGNLTSIKEEEAAQIESAIIAAGWYFKNPYPKPDFTSGDYEDNGFGEVDKRQYKLDLSAYEKAQSRVISRERTYIFKIKEK